MSTPWPPRFEFYEAMLDDDRLIILVDLAAADHAPLTSHGLRLHVRVQMLEARDDGLRSPEESQALFEFEDRMVPALERELQAIFLGRFVARRATTFIFMIPEGQGGSVAKALEAAGDPAPYRPHWLTKSDPSWHYYWDFLYPDGFSYQCITNRNLLRQLGEAGDQLELPRLVDHWAYLPTAEACRQAAQELTDKGFRCDEPGPPSEDAHATDWTLHFQLETALDCDQADTSTWDILQILDALSGTYDGWGAPIAKPN